MAIHQVLSLLLLIGGIVLIRALAKHLKVDRAGRKEMARAQSEAPAADVAAMNALLTRMEDRITTLERILDADDPKWRARL